MAICLCVGHLALHSLSLFREFPSPEACLSVQSTSMSAIYVPSLSLLLRAHDSGLVNQKYLSQI